jgi:hypothetical protein
MFDSIKASAAECDACVSIIILKVSGGQLTSFVRAHRSRVVLCMMDKRRGLACCLKGSAV